MLNETQRRQLHFILKMYYETVEAECFPYEIIIALNSILKRKLEMVVTAFIKVPALLQAIEQIHSIYKHPCPQNRCESAVYLATFNNPDETYTIPDTVLWKKDDKKGDNLSNLCWEQQGLLGLTPFNNDLTSHVTRDDVIVYMDEFFQQKLLKINQLQKSFNDFPHFPYQTFFSHLDWQDIQSIQCISRKLYSQVNWYLAHTHYAMGSSKAAYEYFIRAKRFSTQEEISLHTILGKKIEDAFTQPITLNVSLLSLNPQTLSDIFLFLTKQELSHLADCCHWLNICVKSFKTADFICRAYKNLDSDNYQQALNDCKHAIQLDPSSPHVYIIRGIIKCLYEKSFKEAIIYFDLALYNETKRKQLKHKDLAKLFYYKGSCYQQEAIESYLISGRNLPTIEIANKAISCFEEALSFNVLNIAPCYTSLSVLFLNIFDDYLTALTCRNIAISTSQSTDSRYRDNHFERAIIWEKFGEYDKALADYDHFFIMQSDKLENYNKQVLHECYQTRGNFLVKLKRYEAAVSDFSHALLLMPDAKTYYWRGYCYLKMNNVEAGMQDHKALEKLKKLISKRHDRRNYEDISAFIDKLDEKLAEYEEKTTALMHVTFEHITEFNQSKEKLANLIQQFYLNRCELAPKASKIIAKRETALALQLQLQSYGVSFSQSRSKGISFFASVTEINNQKNIQEPLTQIQELLDKSPYKYKLKRKIGKQIASFNHAIEHLVPVYQMAMKELGFRQYKDIKSKTCQFIQTIWKTGVELIAGILDCTPAETNVESLNLITNIFIDILNGCNAKQIQQNLIERAELLNKKIPALIYSQKSPSIFFAIKGECQQFQEVIEGYFNDGFLEYVDEVGYFIELLCNLYQKYPDFIGTIIEDELSTERVEFLSHHYHQAKIC